MSENTISNGASVVKPSYWAVIPASVRYDTEIPPNAKLLYAEISSLTGETGYCYAVNAYFEQNFELSERTVKRLLKSLEDRGYIRIEDNDGGTTRRRIYAGINPMSNMPPGGDKNDTGGDKNGTGGVTKMTPPSLTRNINNNPLKPPKGRGRVQKTNPEWEPEAFERFWQLYPRGEDRAGAVREWDALRPDRALMLDMSRALKRQKESDEWQRGIGIPYACRWIKNRRWQDELREPETGTGWAADPEVS